MDAIVDFVTDLHIDVVVLIRSFYLLVAAGILFLYNVPALRTRFLAYGARTTSVDGKTPTTPQDDGLLTMFANLTVPHAYFIHFYTLSIGALLLWFGQIAAQQPILHFVLQYTHEPENPVAAVQVIIAWLAILVLSIRRYLEENEKEPSESRMFFGHWIMGLLFYSVTSVAVWIEGDRQLIAHTLGTSLDPKEPITAMTIFKRFVLLLAPNDLPTQKRIFVVVGLLIFFSASMTQSNFHGYLRYMKRLTQGDYTLPDHPLFDYTVTPHYLAECFEYIGLALILAPVGQIFNTTMLCCVVFVVVNLGITADGTREWYRAKFGEEAVKGKARMVPLIW